MTEEMDNILRKPKTRKGRGCNGLGFLLPFGFFSPP